MLASIAASCGGNSTESPGASGASAFDSTSSTLSSGTTSTTLTPTTATLPQTPVSTATTGENGDRELPPGLEGIVSILLGGGTDFPQTWCLVADEPAVHFIGGVLNGESRIGSTVFACLEGFSVDEPINLSIMGPKGVVLVLEMDETYVEAPWISDPNPGVSFFTKYAEFAYWIAWLNLPEHELGRYTFTATQGIRNAAASYELVDDVDSPTLWVLPVDHSDFDLFHHPSFELGDTVDLLLVGWHGHDEAMVHIWDVGGTPEADGYMETVVVPIDALGRGEVSLSNTELGADVMLCPVLDVGIMRTVFEGGTEWEPETLASEWCDFTWFSIGDPGFDRQPES